MRPPAISFLTAGLLVLAPYSIHAQTPAVPAMGSSLPAYDDSGGGLKHQLEDAMKAAKNHDRTILVSLTANMVLPDPHLWFTKVFGAEIGADYETQYAQSSSRITSDLANLLEHFVADKFTELEVVRFTKACDPNADEMEYPVLVSREDQEPLNAVHFRQGNSYNTLQYFAYVGGTFRFIGNLKPYSNPTPSAAGTTPVKLSQNIQAARALKQVPPIYPEEARRQHLQGDVVLETLITREEGATTVLRVLKGRCVLAGPAINAVRQWRYSPTLVEGNPVEVDTTITVTFSLGH